MILISYRCRLLLSILDGGGDAGCCTDHEHLSSCFVLMREIVDLVRLGICGSLQANDKS